MGDMVEVFRMMREYNRLRNRTKESDAKMLIYAWTGVYGYEVKEIQDYQLRIIGNDKKVDIFPINQKYHDITNNIRGRYKKLEQFLNKHFGIEFSEINIQEEAALISINSYK